MASLVACVLILSFCFSYRVCAADTNAEAETEKAGVQPLGLDSGVSEIESEKSSVTDPAEAGVKVKRSAEGDEKKNEKEKEEPKGEDKDANKKDEIKTDDKSGSDKNEEVKVKEEGTKKEGNEAATREGKKEAGETEEKPSEKVKDETKNEKKEGKKEDSENTDKAKEEAKKDKEKGAGKEKQENGKKEDSEKTDKTKEGAKKDKEKDAGKEKEENGKNEEETKPSKKDECTLTLLVPSSTEKLQAAFTMDSQILERNLRTLTACLLEELHFQSTPTVKSISGRVYDVHQMPDATTYRVGPYCVDPKECHLQGSTARCYSAPCPQMRFQNHYKAAEKQFKNWMSGFNWKEQAS